MILTVEYTSKSTFFSRLFIAPHFLCHLHRISFHFIKLTFISSQTAKMLLGKNACELTDTNNSFISIRFYSIEFFFISSTWKKRNRPILQQLLRYNFQHSSLSAMLVLIPSHAMAGSTQEFLTSCTLFLITIF